MFSCRWIVALSLALLVVSSARADTLVTKDGRKFTGEITKADGMYSVKTKMGTVPIPQGDVDQIIPGDSAPAPSSLPVAPKPSATGTTAANPSATGPAAISPGGKLDPKLVPALLQQGQSALAAGEYPAARDAFSDAASLDSHNLTALHGKALALMYLGDFRHAAEPMERALAVNPSPDRAVVINAAVMYIGLRESLRSAKLVRAYLTAHLNEVDEPMLNALAVALNSCDAQSRRAPFFTECADFYVAANAKLEEHAPGYKRWGIGWLTTADADAKNKEWRRGQRSAELLERELGYEEAKVVDCQKKLEDAYAANGRGPSYYVDQARRQLDQAKSARDDTNAKWREAMDNAHGPEFPRTMVAVALDDLKAPAVNPSAPTLAVVTPPPTSPAETPRPPKPARPPEGGSDNTHLKPTVEHPAEPAPDASEPAVVLAVKPKQRASITTYAVAFPVTPDLLLTTAASVEGSSEVSLQSSDGALFKGTVVRTDPATGLGLVRLSEQKINPLALGEAMVEGTVRCASFPTPNIFTPNAEMIPGSAASGADGWKLKLPRNPRLAGGPVLAGGKVIAVEMATRDADPGQLACVTIEQLLKFLGSDAPKTPGTNSNAVGTILQLSATRESK